MHIVQTLQVYSDYSCFKPKRMNKKKYISEKNRIIHLKKIILSDKKSKHDRSTGTHIEVLVDTTRSSLQHIHTDSAHTQIGSGVYKLF